MKKNYLLLLLLAFTVKYSTAQEKGFTAKGIKGVSKSLSEVIAEEKAHPLPANFIARLRPEHEGPEPVGHHPGAPAVSKYGSLVDNNAAASAAVNAASSLPAYSNFLAIWGSYAIVSGRESPYTPPDNNGDVGFTQVIATANCRMKVFNKPTVTGAAATTPSGSSTITLTDVVNVNLNTFFANPDLGITGISDPHVRFDRFSGRWFIVAIDVDHNTNNYCCIAVSPPGDITPFTVFERYYFNVSGTKGSANDFFDYPTLGIDKNLLYIGGNMFANSSSYSGSNMWVIDRAALLASSPSLNVTSFPHGSPTSDIYTPQGVHNDDENATAGFFIGASRTYYSRLVIKRVNYNGGAPTISSDYILGTATTYTPKTVPTLNGTTIDGGDRRPYAAMIKKNKIDNTTSLWIAQGTRLTNSGVGSSRGDRDGAYWAQIGNLSGTPVIQQSAMLYDGVNTSKAAENYIYPTIATSGQGHSLMGFTSAGAKKYCQAATANRFRTDPSATFNSALDFTSSTSSYRPGASRWGDYTQTVVDPEDDMTMWTFSQYAATTDAWGVRAAQFKAPPPPTPIVSNVTSCGSPITITASSTNHAEFFEPGSSYAKHLQVSVSPNTATVNGISSVSPTQITADITFNANGNYTLTVTNPDGQSATSATFSVNCSGLRTTNLITTTTGSKPAINSTPVNETVAMNKPTELKTAVTKTTIYPNPVHDILNLVNGNGNNAVIQILDSKGHLIQQLRSSAANTRINVVNFASGMYTIKIITGNKVDVQRFVKN